MGEFEDLPKYVKEALRKKAVSVQPVGRQSGSSRFPVLLDKYHDLTAEEDELPPVKEWRLNLTVLSKVYNLYFVAYSDRIYVYRPNFPNQSLPLAPAIILDPKKTPEARGGYIDRDDPHSVNNVFIDFLGNLEIILVCCDDGDVIGYYTHKVEDAIKRLSTEEQAQDLSFFATNVGKSAWGLSIHSGARKIAISANTSEVTVVAFGLVPPKASRPPSGLETLLEWDKNTIVYPGWRDSDQKFILGGVNQNIPSVTFCNNEEDMEGRLLAFGALTGRIYIVDLHQLRPMTILSAGFCQKKSESGFCHCGDHYVHAPWGLSWLPRKAFHKVPTQMVRFHSNPEHLNAWDGSEKTSVIPDARAAGHYSHFATLNSSEGRTPSPSVCPGQSEAEPSDATSTTSSVRSRNIPSIDNVLDFQDFRWKPIQPPRPHRVDNVLLLTEQTVPEGTVNPKPDEPEFNYPCPFFVASKQDCCIIQPRDHLGSFRPIIGYLKPLHQVVVLDEHDTDPPLFLHEYHVDRLSLQVYIPELGVIAVGTPMGRVAIFTLCQSKDKEDGGPVFWHRLDWMLPLKSQEDNSERPKAKLVGIAVGPVQGQLGMWDGVRGRRWRMMLHYKDHTILSYELKQEEEKVFWKDGPGTEAYRRKARARQEA